MAMGPGQSDPGTQLFCIHGIELGLRQLDPELILQLWLTSCDEGIFWYFEVKMKSQLEVKISFFQSCKDDDGGDHDNDNGDVNEVEEDDDDAVESKEAGHAWLTDRRSKPLTQEEKQADIIIINIFVNIFVNIIIINTRPWPAFGRRA